MLKYTEYKTDISSQKKNHKQYLF